MAERGRPTKFTEQIADYICDNIAQGVTLSEICREDGMPNRSTIYDWMEANEAFSRRFARARVEGFDAIAEECFDIADDGRNDWMQRNIGSEDTPLLVEQLNSEHIQRSKLRIETRLKLLAKWDPKRFGDKMDVTSGGESIKPTALQIEIIAPKDVDE